MKFFKITKIALIFLISSITLSVSAQDKYLELFFDLDGTKDYENMVMRYKVKLDSIYVGKILYQEKLYFADDTIPKSGVELELAGSLPYNEPYIDTTELYISGIGMEIKYKDSTMLNTFTYRFDPHEYYPILFCGPGEGHEGDSMPKQPIPEKTTLRFTSHYIDMNNVEEIIIFASYLGKYVFERPVDISDYDTIIEK